MTARYNAFIMNDLPDEKLPGDLPACHDMIKELRLKVRNLRRLVVGSYGYDPTESSAVLGYAEAMSRSLQNGEGPGEGAPGCAPQEKIKK